MATLVSSIPDYQSKVITQTVATPRLWHAYTLVFAAACVMVGVYWDISWHMSIGRDTFWTPAHLLIQAGGLIAGISSGYVALETTFAGTRGRARRVGRASGDSARRSARGSASGAAARC